MLLKGLGVPSGRYSNMSKKERCKYAFNLFKHGSTILQEFVGLPQRITIPEDVYRENEENPGYITEYISDYYGYRIKRL